MGKNELQMVADHMGHHLDIHTQVYRMESDLAERTKVARVLLAAEQGGLHRHRGKKLDDIPVSGKFVNYYIVVYKSFWCLYKF